MKKLFICLLILSGCQSPVTETTVICRPNIPCSTPMPTRGEIDPLPGWREYCDRTRDITCAPTN